MFIKPRLKPFIEYSWHDNIISFYRNPGVSITLKDPSQYIFNVCKTMDGNLDLKGIKEIIQKTHPKELPYLEKLLEVLNKEYLIEDCEINNSSILSVYEQERWKRNLEFLGAYCSSSESKYVYQSKLFNLNVVVLGLGGVGLNVLLNLAAMGVKKFHIVDFDKVEISNLNRQILYKESDIGRFKVDVAKESILSFLPKGIIETTNSKIESVSDIDNIVQGKDLLVCAADQPRESILDLVNIACVKRNIPYLCGGLDSKWATYYSIIPKISGCMNCWKLSLKDSSLTYQNLLSFDNFVSSKSPNVAIMPLISIVVGLLTNELLKIATGITEPSAVGKLWAYDFQTGRLDIKESWCRNPHCSVCS